MRASFALAYLQTVNAAFLGRLSFRHQRTGLSSWLGPLSSYPMVMVPMELTRKKPIGVLDYPSEEKKPET